MFLFREKEDELKLTMNLSQQIVIRFLASLLLLFSSVRERKKISLYNKEKINN